MPNRMISLERNTNETQIDLTLDLDGTGRYEVDTGCGFLNHMLELFWIDCLHKAGKDEYRRQ